MPKVNNEIRCYTSNNNKADLFVRRACDCKEEKTQRKAAQLPPFFEKHVGKNSKNNAKDSKDTKDNCGGVVNLFGTHGMTSFI